MKTYILGDFKNANLKCLHVSKTATSYQEKMEICCITETLASIKTRIHRKTIEGLHGIFRFFCFTLIIIYPFQTETLTFVILYFRISCRTTGNLLHIFLYTTRSCADGDKRPCFNEVAIFRQSIVFLWKPIWPKRTQKCFMGITCFC